MACLSQETQTADILSLTPATKSNIIQPIRPWGRLYSTYLHLEPVDLESKGYSLGRAEDCDIVITQDKIPIHRIIAISKIHFEITKEDSMVYIKDMSKNGTFLNGNLIGKGVTNILQNDDEIAIGYKGLKVFIFKVINDLDDNKYLPENLRKKYQVSKLLGRGACGEVKLCFEKQTLRPYAVKKIVKAQSFSGKQINAREKILREINILRSLQHPCIIGMFDIEESDDAVFIILEYMEGGELNELVLTTHPINEKQSKQLFYQIAMAVHYLHSNSVIHRDLKPENILLKSSSADTLIKISDFGLSRLLNEETDYSRTVCGTPKYAAPEIIKRQLYGYQADVWSLGVVLYFMLGRDLPFKSEKSLTKDCKCSFDCSSWENVSEEAKDLVRRMLTVDQSERIKMADVLKHAWISEDYGMLEQVDELLYGEHGTYTAYNSSTDISYEEIGSEPSSPPAKRSRVSE